NNVASYAAWTSNGISLNEWHYLVGTYNGSDMKVYVDGIMKANTSRSGIINNSNYPLHIGNSVNEYADPDWYSYLNGSIDEAAIWNRSLSATEIWQLYLAGKWGGSVMHSSQTETGENWTCQITPMDYTQEGTALNSSQLNIRAGNTTPVIKIIANKSVNEDSAPQANWIDLWYNKTDNYTLFYEPFDNTTNVNQQTGLYDNGVLVDDYALSYNTTNRYNASKGTIEFWIKLEWNGTDNKVYRFFDEGPSTLHSPNHLSIGKYYGTTNYVFFVIDNSTQSGGSSAHEVNTCPGNNCALADPSVGNWTTGQWHHIAATWDNTIGIKLYVDGNLIRSLDTTWSRNVTAPVFYIGSALGTQNYANVTFDELRISSIQRENFTQVWDAVDNPSAMNYSIIAQTNASLINCSIVNNRYINCSTPAANQTGSSNVSVQVMNTRGISANDTFTITVLPVSDAPTITNVTIYPSTAYTNSTLNCSAIYSDADNDAGTAYFSWYKNNARQSYATSLVAGNGTGSYAEGNGSNATLNYPSYLAIDSTGNNIYFTDYTNCRVRRISLATNTTSLVAGNGDCSYAEGTGSAAGFVGVYGIASRGDMLFVSDYDNCRVRKINATTNTTYLAAGGGSCNYTEGIGSSAGFNNPAGLAANQNGTYLYVSDYTNNRIRRIDLRTNTTSLIAGNGTAGYAEGNVTNSMINGPYGLAISPDDLYLYFSDWNNHLIRMVDLTTNITSFISGNRTAGYKEGANNQSSFRNPDQLSIDSTGTLLYLADANNNMIRRINLTTNTTSLIAGNGTASYAEGSFMDARFNVPEGIVINPAGTKLYVSDANNNRIRAINLQNAYDSTTANATSGALAWTNILVPSTALVQNDNWTCSAIVYDGVLWSSWSNSTNVTIQQADLTSPVIHLISPANATFTNTSSQTFRCNITDNSAIANLTLYVWNSTNSNIHTNITNLSGTSNSTNFTFTLPYDNAFKWNCLGSDSPGNSNFSSEGNYTITLDTTLPAINLTYPRNITYNINVSAINYTVSDTNLQACWYSTNNGAANTTITCGNNATGLTSNEGSNTWLVSANDSLNNINVSRITFYKDTISPNISITSPANSSNFSTNNVTINYTISDSGGISSCWYTNTSGLVNYSVTCGQNISRIWNEGINNITIYVNDSLNNANSSSVRFIVDTIFPTNLSFGAGTQNNGMNASANSIYANVTAFNDTNFANATFTLWNLSAVVNSTAFAAATYSINWTNLQDTNYTYEVNVTDIVNHVNSTGLRKILLDTAYPLISYGAGTNASGINVSRTWIYVNVSMTETNFRNITFRLFNSTANANTTTYATNTFFINFTGLAQENYTYNVTITDTANNMNTTETRGIRIDLTAPAISFSCAPASVQAGGIVACTCIATDNVDLNPAEAYTANPSTANIGTFTTTCTATDSAGNSASLDTTYTVELGGGGGGGGGGGSVPCSPSWACGSWSSCANGQQTRTCTDTKSCSTTAGKPAETQPCEINEPVIEYYSPELQVSTRNNSDVTFTIKARDISGISGITLNTKWFVDGVLAKEDNGGISIESSLLHNFNKNAAVKAVVSNSYKTKEILWNVIVLNIACNEKWQCFWSSCNSEGYSYSQNCIDQNNCGTNAEKPVSVLCYIDPVTGEMSPFAGSTTCIPKWICGEWSECNVVYKMEDALKGETLTEGRQERTCDDINRCQPSRLEYQPCVFNIPISMRIVELCNENYIEIYDLQKNMLVSRLKESRIKDTTKLDIRLATANLTGYCDYCYDKIKDYDEEAVDCGGANCPICTEIPFGIDYRDIIAGWAKFISWSLLPVLIAVFISSIVSLRKRRIYEAERLRHIEPRRIKLRRQKPQGIIKERFFR
ncbi:hypothetical protein HYT26_01895, partial [Candidatus Pacearchaeota archaeon]|nr:hypothetical protein [Candidatus Pacearchaeota archaeon]